MSTVFDKQVFHYTVNTEIALSHIRGAVEFLSDQYVQSNYNRLSYGQCEKLRELADKIVELRALTENEYAVDHFATIESWEESNRVEETPAWQSSESSWQSSSAPDWQYSNC